MNFDELQRRWAAQDAGSAAAFSLDPQQLRQRAVAASRARLGWWRAGVTWELLLNAVAVLLLGSFLGDHFEAVRFAAPAALLLLAAIAYLSATIRQLAGTANLDYDGAVLDSQRRLAAVRVLRLRTTKWVFVLAPLLWVPLLIVALRGLLGIDAYATLDTGWLIANAAFGVLCVPLLLGLAHRLAARTDGSPWLRRLARDLAGPSLTAAQEQLAAIAEFERD